MLPWRCRLYNSHFDLFTKVLVWVVFLFNFYLCLTLFQDPDKPGSKPYMQEYEIDLNKYVM